LEDFFDSLGDLGFDLSPDEVVADFVELRIGNLDWKSPRLQLIDDCQLFGGLALADARNIGSVNTNGHFAFEPFCPRQCPT